MAATLHGTFRARHGVMVEQRGLYSGSACEGCMWYSAVCCRSFILAYTSSLVGIIQMWTSLCHLSHVVAIGRAKFRVRMDWVNPDWVEKGSVGG
eukprot:293772-Pyramimonas_sp.AAC.1